MFSFTFAQCKCTLTYLYGLNDGEAPDLRLTELTAESGLSVSEGIGLSPCESAILAGCLNLIDLVIFMLNLNDIASFNMCPKRENYSPL